MPIDPLSALSITGFIVAGINAILTTPRTINDRVRDLRGFYTDLQWLGVQTSYIHDRIERWCKQWTRPNREPYRESLYLRFWGPETYRDIVVLVRQIADDLVTVHQKLFEERTEPDRMPRRYRYQQRLDFARLQGTGKAELPQRTDETARSLANRLQWTFIKSGEYRDMVKELKSKLDELERRTKDSFEELHITPDSIAIERVRSYLDALSEMRRRFNKDWRGLASYPGDRAWMIVLGQPKLDLLRADDALAECAHFELRKDVGGFHERSHILRAWDCDCMDLDAATCLHATAKPEPVTFQVQQDALDKAITACAISDLANTVCFLSGTDLAAHTCAEALHWTELSDENHLYLLETFQHGPCHACDTLDPENAPGEYPSRRLGLGSRPFLKLGLTIAQLTTSNRCHPKNFRVHPVRGSCNEWSKGAWNEQNRLLDDMTRYRINRSYRVAVEHCLALDHLGRVDIERVSELDKCLNNILKPLQAYQKKTAQIAAPFKKRLSRHANREHELTHTQTERRTESCGYPRTPCPRIEHEQDVGKKGQVMVWSEENCIQSETSSFKTGL